MCIIFHTQGVTCNWVKILTVSVQILCTFNTTVSTLEGYKFIIGTSIGWKNNILNVHKVIKLSFIEVKK